MIKHNVMSVPWTYNYVDVVGKGCEGWLNLFFGDHFIGMVTNLELADEIRKVTPKRTELQ